MDAAAKAVATPRSESFKSRPGALIWFFHKSRERWKSKYHELKRTVKALKNQTAAVTKSRERWRLKAQQAQARLSALEAEIAQSRAQPAAGEKKTRQARRPARLHPR